MEEKDSQKSGSDAPNKQSDGNTIDTEVIELSPGEPPHDDTDANALKTPQIESKEHPTNAGSDSQQQQNVSRPAKKLWFVALGIFCCVLILTSAVAVSLYYRNKALIDTSATQGNRIDSLAKTLEKLRDVDTQLQSRLSETARDRQAALRQLEQRNAALDTRIQNNEARLRAQNRRLLSMSTTSREDWLLAEAEYLLRLANQRVLVERSPTGAIGLLEEADAILRDLEDPDLFSLRKTIQEDLVALKLVEQVDVEGIYLKLNALADQVETLPLVRDRLQYETKTPAPEKSPEPELEPEKASSVASALKRFTQTLDRYVRVIDHQEKPTVLLPPDSGAYLQLNLRLILERAQLALLREQPEIFVSSLAQSATWLTKYYPETQAMLAFRHEITQLKAIDIQTTLPDISTSLEMLHVYIEQLHKLENSASTNNKPKSQSEAP